MVDKHEFSWRKCPGKPVGENAKGRKGKVKHSLPYYLNHAKSTNKPVPHWKGNEASKTRDMRHLLNLKTTNFITHHERALIISHCNKLFLKDCVYLRNAHQDDHVTKDPKIRFNICTHLLMHVGTHVLPCAHNYLSGGEDVSRCTRRRLFFV